jgi:hypothetical protein
MKDYDQEILKELKAIRFILMDSPLDNREALSHVQEAIIILESRR